MNNQNKINIFDCLSDLTYNKSNINFLTDAIFDYHEHFPNNEIYKVAITIGGSYQHKVLAIRHKLSANLHQKYYDIIVILYLMNDYPNIPPEVYLDRSIPKVGINPKYIETQEIHPNTYKLSNNYLLTWKKTTSNLKSLINEINIRFNELFPIYNKNDQEIKPNKNSLAFFNLQDKLLIDFGTTTSSYRENEHKIINKTFSEEEIRELFMKEVYNNLKPLLAKKYEAIKNDEDIANEFNKSLNGGVENMVSVLSNRSEFINEIDRSINQLKSEISILQKDLDLTKNNVDFSNIENIIEISNEKVIRAVSLEANIEELLLITKKAFERKIVDLEETIKFVRNLSRESFKIKCYREKLLK